MKKTQKSFDCVRMMRDIRQRLSERLRHMTFEEQRQYIRERLRSQKAPRHRPRPTSRASDS